MNLYLSALLLLGLVLSVQAGEGDSYDKRCRYFDFIRACKVGCKALGHTTGIVTSTYFVTSFYGDVIVREYVHMHVSGLCIFPLKEKKAI